MPVINPDQAQFFPSCVVNLRVRFDESLKVSNRDLPGPLTLADPLVQRRAAFPSLDQVMADVGRPLVMGAPQDDMSYILNRLPKEASVDLSGYRQAGKWSLTFDYRDFPIDPRAVRSMAVEIHLGAVPPADFAEGMVRIDPRVGRRSVLQTRVNGVMREDTLLVMGTADSIHSEWASQGSWVKMEGRDLRGIFLDAAARPDLLSKLDLRRPIDQVVEQILSQHAFGGSVRVVVNEDDWPDRKVPSPGEAQDMTRVNMGAAGSAPNMRPQGDPHKLSVWDIITSYCYLVGAIPYFVGQRLRVRPARSLYDYQKKAGFDPGVPTPFAGGKQRTVDTEQGPRRINLRQMVFGRNIERLEFERKLAGTKVPVVEVVSLDTSSETRGRGKLLIVRYPPPDPSDTPSVGEMPASEPVPASNEEAGQSSAGAANTSVAPSGGAVDRQVIRIPVAGIRSKERLRRIAQDIYEEIGRGEMGGKIQTKSLASFGGGNSDPDLLFLRPGDPIELLFDARSLQSSPPLASDITDVEARLPFDEAVRQLTERLGDANLARVLVATSRGQVDKLQSFFRVANVHFGFSADSGVDIAFDFQNYVESRYNVTKQEENKAAPRTTVVRTVASRQPAAASFLPSH